MNSENETANFDTERFIVEVHSRIALWDITTEEYSNRDLKKQSWEELVDIFINKDATASERNECGKLLQRKWKSLRDCFTRECQRLRTGTLGQRRSQYVFYNQLSFLHKVIKSKDTTINVQETAIEVIPDVEHMTTISPEPSVERWYKRKKVDKLSPDVEQLVNVLQAGIQSREERKKAKEEDGDRLFLLSLLNPMKQIPEHLRFSVRLQIMQVIQNASKRVSSSDLDESQQSSFEYDSNQQSHHIETQHPDLKKSKRRRRF